MDEVRATATGRRDRGASVAEYALLLGLVVLVAVGALTLLGRNSETKLAAASEAVDGGTDGGSAEAGSPGGGSEGTGTSTPGPAGGGAASGGTSPTTAAPTTTAPPTTMSPPPTTAPPAPAPGDDGGDGSEGHEPPAPSEVEEVSAVKLPNGAVLSATGGEGRIYWWDAYGQQGQWVARAGFTNDSDRHQYLTLEVVRVRADGSRSTETVKDFYVGAGGSATYEAWSNDIRADRKKADVVAVEVRVRAVRTYDQAWRDRTYKTDGPEIHIEAPTP